MNKDDDKDKKEIRIFGFTLWFWIGLSLFIAYVVAAHIEKNSPSAEANRQRLYQNAVNEMYQDAYNSCTDSEELCREEADHAADFTRDRLGARP